jgi:hypothetical protein
MKRLEPVAEFLVFLLGLAILVAGSTGYVVKVLWELRGALGR